MSAYTGSVPASRRKADWRDDALCRAEDPEDFFPVGATPVAKATERHAKAVCFRCPSLQACGQWALETRQPFGVWGGMTEAERAKILRRRKIRLPVFEDEPA
jgi:WhiB family transcriptional regulator, redox-sensing transcriptional regulator